MNSQITSFLKSIWYDHRYMLSHPWPLSNTMKNILLQPRSITTFVLFILISSFQWVNAQEVDVSVSYDTVYIGNVLGVQYSMEDWQGEVAQPDFGEFKIVGGPQISSSMSYSGGKRSSSTTILFYLKPPDQKGTYQLPSQIFRGGNEEASTEEKDITVLENPDHIEQNPAIEKKPPRAFNRQHQRESPPRGQRQRF